MTYRSDDTPFAGFDPIGLEVPFADYEQPEAAPPTLFDSPFSSFEEAGDAGQSFFKEHGEDEASCASEHSEEALDGDQGEQSEAEGEAAALVTETLDAFVERLGDDWSRRLNGTPTPSAMRAWLRTDHDDTQAGARQRWGSKYGKGGFTAGAITRAWMLSRESQMRFRTEGARVKPLGRFAPPTQPEQLVTHPSIDGSDKAPVAPLMVDFVRALRARYASGFRATNYRGHGGGAFLNRGHSLDLFLGALDSRGFYKPEEAKSFLRAVAAAASEVGARWRVIYNDFDVANAINRETGHANVIFVGSARRNAAKQVLGLNWHGPAPLILHFHLDLAAPSAGATHEAPTEERLAWLDYETASNSEDNWHEMPAEEVAWHVMPGRNGEPDEQPSGHAVEDEASTLATLEALIESEIGRGTAAAGRAKAALALAIGPVLRRGSMGPAVTALQRALSLLGGDIAVDGAFGQNTDRAVRSFQSRHGLAPDGVVGPRTKTHLARALREPDRQGGGGGYETRTKTFANFANDSADVPSEHVGPLGELARELVDGKVATVDVVGHTSSEGDDGYNDALGQRRAEAVVRILGAECERHARGGAVPALMPSSRGERQLAGADSPGNRRVVVTYNAPAPVPGATMEATLRRMLTASMLLAADPLASFTSGSLPPGKQSGTLWDYELELDGQAMVAKGVGAKVAHGAHMMRMPVLRSARWHDVTLTLATGVTARLPLTADFLLGSFSSAKGSIAGHSLWRLPATLDVGTCAVFAFDLRDPSAPGKVEAPAQFGGPGGAGASRPPWAIVVCELVCNRALGDFETTTLLDFARIYPLIEVLSSDATTTIEGAVELIRPTKSPMSHGWANGGEHLVGFYADRNESLGMGAALLDFFLGRPNPTFPSWDVLFEYVDRNGAATSQTLTMVDPTKTGTRTSGTARKVLDRKTGTYLATTASKEPRQGEFDNIHLSPPMLAGPLATPAIGALPSQALIPATPVSMAPACVHDCFHVHWRWSRQFTRQPQLGWGPAGPYSLAGAPMVHPNQTVRLATTKGVPGFDYRASAARHPANDWMVVMHHGAGYAVSMTADPTAPLESAMKSLGLPAVATTAIRTSMSTGTDAIWAWIYFFFQKWPAAPILGKSAPPAREILDLDLPALRAL